MARNLTTDVLAPRGAALPGAPPRSQTDVGDADWLAGSADGFADFMRAADALSPVGTEPMPVDQPMSASGRTAIDDPGAILTCATIPSSVPPALSPAVPRDLANAPGTTRVPRDTPAMNASALPDMPVGPADRHPHRLTADPAKAELCADGPNVPAPATPPLPLSAGPVRTPAQGALPPARHATAKDDRSPPIPGQGPSDAPTATQAQLVLSAPANAANTTLLQPDQALAASVTAVPRPLGPVAAAAASDTVAPTGAEAGPVPVIPNFPLAGTPNDPADPPGTASASIAWAAQDARPSGEASPVAPSGWTPPRASPVRVTSTAAPAMIPLPAPAAAAVSPDMSSTVPRGPAPPAPDAVPRETPMVGASPPARSAAGIDIRTADARPRARPDSLMRASVLPMPAAAQAVVAPPAAFHPAAAALPQAGPAPGGNGPPAPPPALPAEARPDTASGTPELPDLQGLTGQSVAQAADSAVPPPDRSAAPAMRGDTALSELPRGSALRAQPPEVRHAAAAPSVNAQISHAVAALPDHPVELILSPRELGHVRLHLSAADGVATVAVTAERPETLDLIRRHADDLARDFRDLGYRDVTFSFGQDRRPADRHGDHAAEVTPASGDDAPASPPLPRAYPAAPRKAAPDGAALDIRL